MATDSENAVSERCAYCKEPFGYDALWDDPVEDGKHIEVTWNPEEPAFAVGETRYYCSPRCLLQDTGELPFDSDEAGIADNEDTDS